MKYRITYLDNQYNRKTEDFNDDKSELIDLFKVNNYKIISIDEIEEKSSNDILFKNRKIRQREITSFLKQFSILLTSGINMKYALNILMEQEKSKSLKDALYKINNFLEVGYSLSIAFEKTNVFPKLVCGVIEAGENSSQLPKALSILAKYYEDDEKIRQTLKNAMYYPVILLFVTFIVVSLVVSFVLPKYVELFNSYNNLEMPFLTILLINISRYISKYWMFFIVFILLITLIVIKLMTSKIKLRLSKFLLNVPIIGNYIINYEVQRFSGIFAILIEAGIDTIKSIEIASKSIKNYYLSSSIYKLNKKILEGNTLYISFKTIKELPNMFLNLVNVGEVSSNLSQTMDISFNYFKNVVEMESKRITALFEPIIIVLVAILVGIVVVAIALPTFNIVNII